MRGRRGILQYGVDYCGSTMFLLLLLKWTSLSRYPFLHFSQKMDIGVDDSYASTPETWIYQKPISFIPNPYPLPFR
jgi:hypothetical protein